MSICCHRVSPHFARQTNPPIQGMHITRQVSSRREADYPIAVVDVLKWYCTNERVVKGASKLLCEIGAAGRKSPLRYAQVDVRLLYAQLPWAQVESAQVRGGAKNHPPNPAWCRIANDDISSVAYLESFVREHRFESLKRMADWHNYWPRVLRRRRAMWIAAPGDTAWPTTAIVR